MTKPREKKREELQAEIEDGKIRYNIFRKLKNKQKDRHAQRTLVE